MDIDAKVKEIIMNKLGVDEGQVTPEASFTNDLGADSLDTVELVMEFEKAFGMQIPDEDAEKIGTVGDAVKYIQSPSPPDSCTPRDASGKSDPGAPVSARWTPGAAGG